MNRTARRGDSRYAPTRCIRAGYESAIQSEAFAGARAASVIASSRIVVVLSLMHAAKQRTDFPGPGGRAPDDHLGFWI
jgi:hypothetical protein